MNIKRSQNEIHVCLKVQNRAVYVSVLQRKDEVLIYIYIYIYMYIVWINGYARLKAVSPLFYRLGFFVAKSQIFMKKLVTLIQPPLLFFCSIPIHVCILYVYVVQLHIVPEVPSQYISVILEYICLVIGLLLIAIVTYLIIFQGSHSCGIFGDV